MKNDIAELIDKQNEIIKAQSDIISKLFLKLLEYTTVAELDNCEIVSDIKEIAKLRS
jgi:hypothetical protein